MADTSSDLASGIAEMDDGYLKVMLLLSARRAQTEEPRRAGFWHALAVALAEEQESRRGAAELGAEGAGPAPDDTPELEAVVEELRRELASLESELQEAGGDMKVAGD